MQTDNTGKSWSMHLREMIGKALVGTSVEVGVTSKNPSSFSLGCQRGSKAPIVLFLGLACSSGGRDWEGCMQGRKCNPKTRKRPQ